jgi:hypothetical protein
MNLERRKLKKDFKYYHHKLKTFQRRTLDYLNNKIVNILTYPAGSSKMGLQAQQLGKLKLNLLCLSMLIAQTVYQKHQFMIGFEIFSKQRFSRYFLILSFYVFAIIEVV